MAIDSVYSQWHEKVAMRRIREWIFGCKINATYNVTINVTNKSTKDDFKVKLSDNKSNQFHFNFISINVTSIATFCVFVIFSTNINKPF